MQIVCKKCGYTWETASTAKRISCSKCKTSITMPQGVGAAAAAPSPITAAKKVLEEAEIIKRVEVPPSVKRGGGAAEEEIRVIKRVEVPQRLCLPIKLLDSIAFDRAKSWARTNGEEYITLKADGEGILAL